MTQPDRVKVDVMLKQGYGRAVTNNMTACFGQLEDSGSLGPDQDYWLVSFGLRTQAQDFCTRCNQSSHIRAALEGEADLTPSPSPKVGRGEATDVDWDRVAAILLGDGHE